MLADLAGVREPNSQYESRSRLTEAKRHKGAV